MLYNTPSLQSMSGSPKQTRLRDDVHDNKIPHDANDQAFKYTHNRRHSPTLEERRTSSALAATLKSQTLFSNP